MFDLLRNAVAFASTFTVTAAVVMMAAHCIIVLSCGRRRMSVSYERLVFFIGIAVALLLIPFYYFPA